MPFLPTNEELAQSVEEWSAVHPTLAALSATGLPLDKVLTRWGLALLKKSDWKLASSVLRGALALRPQDAGLWLNCGISFDQANDINSAIACFKESVRLSPQLVDGWLLLGLAHKKLGNLADAESAYKRTLELEPTFAVAWQCLGLLKEEERDYGAAMESYTKCIGCGGGSAPVWANLGKLRHQTGKFLDARNAYQEAVRLDPANSHYAEMWRKTALICDLSSGRPILEAVEAYRAAGPTTEEGLIAELDRCIVLLGGFGHTECALKLGRQRLELWPPTETTKYILQAMSGEAALDRSPAEFIVEHFDAVAGSFDSHLVTYLGYDIPGKMMSAILKITPSGHLYDALDAGCGTGLCGPLLRPFARTLTGVDLSSKMLEQVARRGLYDETACEDLTVFLRRFPGRFDLVVSADVVIYFGDLAPVFAAAAIGIRPGGLFGFSTESAAEGRFRLQTSGRFAHTP